VEQVLSKSQVCKQANISDRTLDRENAAGRGPVRTQLGLRRWGVTVSNFDDWLASRRIAPRGLVDAPVRPASPAPCEDARLTERPPNVARRRPLPAAGRLDRGSRRHPKQPPSPVNVLHSGGSAFAASSTLSSPRRLPHGTNIVGKLPSPHSLKKRKPDAERENEDGSR
jgi:hypothetical protein